MVYQSAGSGNIFPLPKERLSKRTNRAYHSFGGSLKATCSHCGSDTSYWLNGFYTDEEVAAHKAIQAFVENQDLKQKESLKFDLTIKKD